MGNAGVEPDIQGVLHLLIARALLGAEQILRMQLEPGIDALRLDALGDFFDQPRGARMQLAGFLIDQQRDRHAPGALPRDAPVRAIAHHAVDARLTPVRHPAHGADLAQRGLAQAGLLHADEPLRGRAKDDRGLVPPAMRVAVREALLAHQRLVRLQRLDHLLIGIEDVLAGEQRRAVQKAPVAADRIIDLQVVAAADDVVLQAMAGSGMHRAGPGLERDMLAKDNRHPAVIKRVLELQPLEGIAAAIGDDPIVLDAPAVHGVLEQPFGDQQPLRAVRTVLGHLHQRVLELRVQGNRLIRRQGPGRGGPDHHRHTVPHDPRPAPLSVSSPE